MCVFTVGKLCVRSKEGVFTDIFSDNKMTLLLYVGKLPRYKLRETIRMLKTCFRILWHVPCEKSNQPAISEVMFRRTLLTILQTFRTFSCERPVTGRTEPKFNSHRTEKIAQNIVLFPCHAHHSSFRHF